MQYLCEETMEESSFVTMPVDPPETTAQALDTSLSRAVGFLNGFKGTITFGQRGPFVEWIDEGGNKLFDAVFQGVRGHDSSTMKQTLEVLMPLATLANFNVVEKLPQQGQQTNQVVKKGLFEETPLRTVDQPSRRGIKVVSRDGKVLYYNHVISMRREDTQGFSIFPDIPDRRQEPSLSANKKSVVGSAVRFFLGYLRQHTPYEITFLHSGDDTYTPKGRASKELFDLVQTRFPNASFHKVLNMSLKPAATYGYVLGNPSHPAKQVFSLKLTQLTN
jgi:hypothetical protein